MLRSSLIVFLLLGSCSFLIPHINAEPCPDTFEASCADNIVTTCESGFLHQEDCGTLTCDPISLSCEGCGDGATTDLEECDDANQTPGDGCENDCTLTSGAVCGNNLLEAGESCDDGNLSEGDGCDDACQIEPVLCGNNSIENNEECDDGNLINGDSCDDTCQLESPVSCPQAAAIPVGDHIGDNSNGTTNFTATLGDVGGSCDPGDGVGREDLFAIIATTNGRMSISLASNVDLVLYARSDCFDGNSQLGCSDALADGIERTDFSVTAGESITIFVDGFTPTTNGGYFLSVSIN
jgi:cysteine-rich repeat protein